MKKLLIIPLILLCSCSWSKPDLARESLWLLGHYVDYRQTSSAMEQPEKYGELNPLFGKKPSKGRVNSTMALIGAAHLGVTHILKNKKRRRWQEVTIGFKVGVVYNNYYIGVEITH